MLLATNRPDILDPALLRPGRVDRRIEFELPDPAGRERIFRIHSRGMSLERGIRWGGGWGAGWGTGPSGAKPRCQGARGLIRAGANRETS